MTILSKITTKKELRSFLLNEQNAYTLFIQKHQNQQTFKNYALNETELHHIIPLYAKGPDKYWNIIRLSIKDHHLAHELLYKIYKNPEDLCSLNFKKKNYSKAYQLRTKVAHVSQRLNKTGFFNSEIQRKNGIKGGKVKSLKKRLTYYRKISAFWKYLLNNQSVWLYKKTNFIMVINPNECLLPQEVAYKLLTYKPFWSIYKAKIQSFTSCLSRVVNKQRKSASGWVLIQIKKKEK